MNTLSKIALTGVSTVLTLEQTFAAIDAGIGKVDPTLIWNTNTAETAIQIYIGKAMTFLAILAVVYGLYGGFLMVTAGGEEEKMKKGRTILIQVAIGLVVIFLANSIVQFVLTKIL